MSERQGFTLVEVLIALVILLVGILAVLMMHTTSVQQNDVAKEITRKIEQAQEDLEEIIISNQDDYPDVTVDHSAEGVDSDLQLHTITLVVERHGKTVERQIPYLKSDVGMSKRIEIE